MKTRNSHRSTTLQAGICLLAVVLLHAPWAAAALSGQSGESCCAAGHCPVSGQHHSKPPARPGSAANCDRELAEMAACTMDCCQSPERLVGAPLAFLLPPPAPGLPLSDPGEFILDLKAREIPRAIAPSSPPPRYIAAAL
ncbi:MAG: hypothetical protein LAN71_01860 [Acidobacteriia bacterium]|nr:hypothetical protein [Terriglobia bacterium]